MDTVLGLSLTSTTLGWTLLDARDTAGAPLAGEDLGVGRHGGADAGSISAYASAIVARLRPVLGAPDLRIAGIGLAAAADATAAAALVREILTEAGFGIITPVPPQPGGPVSARRAALAPLATVRFATPNIATPAPRADEFTAAPRRRLHYAGAAAMLATGAVTLVVSLSVMLSPQLGPAERATGTPTSPTTARAAAVPSPDQRPQPLPELPATTTPLGALWEGPPAETAPPAATPPPDGSRSLLDRVREKLPHRPGH